MTLQARGWGHMGIVHNLSLRVPWRDRAWDGHVCADPMGLPHLAADLLSQVSFPIVFFGRETAFGRACRV